MEPLMTIDVALLRKQIKFLDNYAWREETMPEEIEGILNLLEAILDKEDN